MERAYVYYITGEKPVGLDEDIIMLYMEHQWLPWMNRPVNGILYSRRAFDRRTITDNGLIPGGEDMI